MIYVVNLPLNLKISFPGVFIVNVVESSSDGDIIAFFNVYFRLIVKRGKNCFKYFRF